MAFALFAFKFVEEKNYVRYTGLVWERRDPCTTADILVIFRGVKRVAMLTYVSLYGASSLIRRNHP